MLRNIGFGLLYAAGYVPALLRDLVGIFAVGLISYGAWQIYPPAGFITAGVLALIGVILLSMKAR